MKPSIEETLIEWLGKNSLEIKSIEVEEHWSEKLDRLVIYKAKGEFHKVGFDKKVDGANLAMDYMFELERRDEKFQGTELIFTSDIEFQIK